MRLRDCYNKHQANEKPIIFEGIARIFNAAGAEALNLSVAAAETETVISSSQDNNNLSLSVGVTAEALFPMAKNLETIKDVWTEYKYGLNEQESILSLNSTKGANSRNGTTANQRFFSQRNTIYKAITHF